jgi:hypothetical protein
MGWIGSDPDPVSRRYRENRLLGGQEKPSLGVGIFRGRPGRRHQQAPSASALIRSSERLQRSSASDQRLKPRRVRSYRQYRTSSRPEPVDRRHRYPKSGAFESTTRQRIPGSDECRIAATARQCARATRCHSKYWPAHFVCRRSFGFQVSRMLAAAALNSFGAQPLARGWSLKIAPALRSAEYRPRPSRKRKAAARRPPKSRNHCHVPAVACYAVCAALVAGCHG